MNLRTFVWRYFRRYRAWGFLALATTVVFAVSMVALLVGLRLLLSDVIKTDPPVAVPSVSVDPAAAEESKDPVRAVFRRFGLDVDMDAMIVEWWHGVREPLGINDTNVVWLLPALFAAVFVVRSLSLFLTSYALQTIGLGSTNDLRNDLYDRILHQSSRFYSEHPSGELVSRVSNDVAVMQNAIANRLLDLFLQPVTLIVVIVFLMLLDFKMAVISLFIMPAVFYPIVRFGKSMRSTSRRSQERLADLANLVAEAVRGHRVVKAFGMERFELERFSQATARHLKVKMRALVLANASGPVVETMAAFGAAAFLIYVGHEVRQENLKPSQIMTFLTGLIMLYDPIRKLNRVNLVFQEATAAAQRVRDVMMIPNDVEDAPGALDLRDAEPCLVFENVGFSYEKTAVLRDLDLVIEPGEVIALVGPSGAGKSTLVNLLPRFFDPNQGRLTLAGHDLRDLTLASLRSNIGIVTQDTVLFNDTVRNNIAYGRSDLSLEEVREAARAAYADEFVMASDDGYDSVIGEGGLKLSGGQRQRLAIARALVKNPPILILDEATSALDSESEALVQKALYNLMSGRTAVVIAHRLSTIKRADRILVMDAGEVVEEGTHETLLGNGGVYQRLYELQFQDL